jgi:hypothetical protein
MNYQNIKVEKIQIQGIPALLMRPNSEMDRYPTVIFYHGWTSNKEAQSFRGFILASLGYQVLIPDSLYHGDRGRIDYDDDENAGAFWDVVFKNLEESEILINTLIEEYKADKGRIALSGHSMGGFTSTGVFAWSSIPKVLVVLNGSGSWEKSNDIFVKTLGIKDTERFREQHKKLKGKDPAGRLEFMKDRHILILHGEDDSAVDIVPQREFYESLKQKYKRQDHIMMVTYKQLNHYVTTNMMEEMGKWLEKYL